MIVDFIRGARALTAVVALLGAGAVSANPIMADLEDFTNGGGFFATVTLANNGVDTVRVTADIADPINSGLTEGDILGLWLDIAPDSLLSILSFDNEDPSGIISTAEFGPANSVGAVGGANNNIGLLFDMGFAFSANGCGDGCYEKVAFDLMAVGLTSAAFDGQRVGMRVQSISGGDFDQIGSSKLQGVGEGGGPPNEVPVPEPGVLALFGIGLAGMGLSGLRRRRRGGTPS